MKILKIIATPFVFIWKWIKETAWVQPLLIVGIIFGIIFAIPSISNWVKGWFNNGDGLDYYETVQLSLNGAYKGESEVDKFLTSYEKAQSFKNGEKNATEADFASFKKEYGEKFFLVFTQSDCEFCENISDGLEELKDNWKNYNVGDGALETYKCWSIICNQEIDKNEQKQYTETKAFEYILNDHSSLFEDMQTFGLRNTYYTNQTSSDKSTIKDYITNFLKGVNDIHVPCVMLFDLSGNKSSNGEGWNYLANTIFFEIPSNYDTNEVTRAKFLAQCWYGKGDFEIKK